MKVFIYEITVYAGSEDEGTLKAVHVEHIALKNEDHLEKVALSILSKYEGDEVTCNSMISCHIMD